MPFISYKENLVPQKFIKRSRKFSASYIVRAVAILLALQCAIFRLASIYVASLRFNRIFDIPLYCLQDLYYMHADSNLIWVSDS